MCVYVWCVCGVCVVCVCVLCVCVCVLCVCGVFAWGVLVVCGCVWCELSKLGTALSTQPCTILPFNIAVYCSTLYLLLNIPDNILNGRLTKANFLCMSLWRYTLVINGNAIGLITVWISVISGRLVKHEYV